MTYGGLEAKGSRLIIYAKGPILLLTSLVTEYGRNGGSLERFMSVIAIPTEIVYQSTRI